VRYVIETNQRCVFLHVSGVIDNWTLARALQRLWGERDFDPQYSRLVDGSEVSDMQTDSDLLQAIATDVRSKPPRKIALVPPASERVRSAFNAYRESLGDVSSRVFTTVEDAVSWLDVDLPQPWPPAVAFA
jgi:hypothetical protein